MQRKDLQVFRLALLIPEGAQPSSIFIPSMSVFDELVAEYSLILVLPFFFNFPAGCAVLGSGVDCILPIDL